MKRKIVLFSLLFLFAAASYASTTWIDPSYRYRRTIEIPLNMNIQFPFYITIENWDNRPCEVMLLVDPETREIFSYSTDSCGKEMKLWLNADKTYNKPLKLHLYYTPLKDTNLNFSPKKPLNFSYKTSISKFNDISYKAFYPKKWHWRFSKSISGENGLYIKTRFYYYIDPILVAYSKINIKGRRLLKYLVSNDLSRAWGTLSTAFFVKVKDNKTKETYHLYYLEGPQFSDLFSNEAKKTFYIHKSSLFASGSKIFKVDPIADLTKRKVKLEDPYIAGIGRAVKTDGGTAYTTLQKVEVSSEMPFGTNISNEETYSIILEAA